MSNVDRKYDKYNNLITDLKNMIDTKGRGYEIAQSLNDNMWEELGTHRKRLEEQINRAQLTTNDKQLQAEIAQADSIYEATRSYIAKHQQTILSQ